MHDLRGTRYGCQLGAQAAASTMLEYIRNKISQNKNKPEVLEALKSLEKEAEKMKNEATEELSKF